MPPSFAPLVLAAALAVVPASLPAQAPPPGTEPCPVEVPVGTGTWRQVRARGITFCLPDDWKESGATGEGDDVRVWQARGSKITLALAGATMPEERSEKFTVRERVVVVRDGEPLPARGSERVPTVEARTALDGRMQEIGGRPAFLTDRKFMNRFSTGATWEAPRVSFAGQARDRTTAGIQMAVYQTVRFTPAATPP